MRIIVWLAIISCLVCSGIAPSFAEPAANNNGGATTGISISTASIVGGADASSFALAGKLLQRRQEDDELAPTADDEQQQQQDDAGESQPKRPKKMLSGKDSPEVASSKSQRAKSANDRTDAAGEEDSADLDAEEKDSKDKKKSNKNKGKSNNSKSNKHQGQADDEDDALAQDEEVDHHQQQDGNDEDEDEQTDENYGFLGVSKGFVSAFGLALPMILVTEIGDRTFFIAAIMAMRHQRLVIFSAAISALIVMTVLSAILGHALPALIPKSWTHAAAIVLFLVFGAMMLRDGWKMSEDEGKNELNEVQAELSEKETKEYTAASEEGRIAHSAGPTISPVVDGGDGGPLTPAINLIKYIFSPVFVQTFSLTFLAEWGDRSQISTIAMAASNNVYGVTIGAIIGHSLCTGLAVIGGRLLASKISVRTVTLVGGGLFILFGLLAITGIMDE